MKAARRGPGAQPHDVVRIAARSVPAACGRVPAVRQHARAVASQVTVLSPGSVVAQGAGAVIRAGFGLIGGAYPEQTPEVASGADF
jgi:hypothetical protein